SFPVLVGLGWELVKNAGRVIDKRGKQYGPTSSERPSSPPQVQSGRMAMPNGFLSRRLLINGLQRERYFNQLFLHLAFRSLPSVADSVIDKSANVSGLDSQWRE